MVSSYTLLSLLGFAVASRAALVDTTYSDFSPFISYSTPDGAARWNHTSVSNSQMPVEQQAKALAVVDACTTGAATATMVGSQLTFHFQGSAVYYNSIANYDGNILSITLDNDPAVQVTAVAPSLEYQCQLLFSKTNLDTTVQHTLNIQLVGLSPETQPGVDGKLPSPMLALDYFVVTAEAQNTSSALHFRPAHLFAAVTSLLFGAAMFIF